MNDTFIAEAAALLALFVTLVTPIIKLNASITRLNTLIEGFREDFERQDGRLKDHGAKIDDLGDKVARHDERISALEEKRRAE